MRKLYSLLALGALLLMNATGVRAQQYLLATMADEPQTGVNYAIVNASISGASYLSATAGLGSVLADDSYIWQLEEADETSDDGYTLYVLKSVGQNAYWQEENFEGVPFSSAFTLHRDAQCCATFGAKETAMHIAIAKSGSSDSWRATAATSNSDGFILSRKNTVNNLFFTSEFKLDVESGKPGFGDNNRQVTWNFYTVEESSPKEKLDALVTSLVNSQTQYIGGSDPGMYNMDKYNAYTAALQSAQTGLTQDLDNDGYTTLFNQLNAAKDSLDNAINPVVEGYYFVVNGLPGFLSQQNTEKALYAASSSQPAWKSFSSSDALSSNDYSFLWHITPYSNGWKLTSAMYGTDYNGPANSTGTGAECQLVSGSARTVYFRSLGNCQWLIYNSYNSHGIHAQGHSGGAGQSGNIVTWDTEADGASAWYLRTVSDSAYIDGAIAYSARVALVDEITPLLQEAAALYENLFVSTADVDNPYITEADDSKAVGEQGNQFLSNRKEGTEGRYAALIDGNTRAVYNASGEDTGSPTNYGPDGQWAYFHSAWNQVTAVGAHSNDTQDFLQVDLSKTPVSSFVLRTARRYNNANAQPTRIAIYATNDTTGFYAGTDTWTRITTITPPVCDREQYYVSPVIDLGSAYSYLRFTVEETNSGGSYFTYSEFNLYPGENSRTLSQYYYVDGMQAAADAMKALETRGNVAAAAVAVSRGLIDSLSAAIAAVKELYVDTSSLKQAIAQAETTLPLAKVGTEIGNIRTQQSIDNYQAALDAAKQVDLEGAVTKDVLTRNQAALASARNAMLLDMVVPTADKWYFLTSQESQRTGDNYTHGAAVYADLTNNHVRWTPNEDGQVADEANAMWRVIPVQSDTANIFYLQNMATGQYMGNQAVTLTALTFTSASPVPFQVAFAGGDNVGLVSQRNNPQGNCLSASTLNNGVIGAAFREGGDQATMWTFREISAETEAVVVPVHTGGQVQTLPFAVQDLSQINNGLSLYAVKSMEPNADSTLTTINLYTKDTFAAGEPFIVVSGDAEQLLVPVPQMGAMVDEPLNGNGLVGVLSSTFISRGKGIYADSLNITATTRASTHINALTGYVDPASYRSAVDGVDTALAYTVSGLIWPERSVYDVNRDGVINSSDVVAIYNFINSGEDSGYSAAQTDVNEDGGVNSSDAVAVYNHISGAE